MWRTTAAVLVILGVLWQLVAGPPAVAGAQRPSVPADGARGAAETARNILLIHVVRRSTPALLEVEQAFMRTLSAAVPEPLAFHSEYLDLGTFDQTESFERELVAYLAAKYARTKLDLVAVEASQALRFALRHRARLFPGVPIAFNSVIRHAAADIPLDAGVSGVWLSIDWAGTLAAARRLQPDLERAVVVTGASPVDRVGAAEARAQLSRLEPPIAISYLEGLALGTVLERVAALPARSVVLLGALLTDATGRRFSGPETTALIAAASAVPVYGTSSTHLGHGAVGGHLISFELQGRLGGEIAARMLRGEQPPPIEGGTHAYRFDARQLRRWGLDPGRLPPGSTVEFDEPSLWQAYRGYIVAGVLVLGLQTWMIIALLASRTKRRRAQRELAGQLRFETMISDLLANQLTAAATGADSQVRGALALIGEYLDVDRFILAERDEARRRAQVVHVWTRDEVPGVPPTIRWSTFPWMAERVARGHVVAVSPLRPLPPEAAVDRQGMLAHGTRSLLAVPLLVEGALVGVLSCATVRHEREWPDALIDRLRLLAGVFASILARRRAEATARESEERVRQHRQELTHALRVNTLGELGASLAHEINQPLSAILINARVTSSLLARGTATQPAMSEALEDIAADARRAADIIARLRALSRKEHSPARGLSLDALVDEVAGLLHQDFVRRGIVVRRVATAGAPPVSGDRIQLQQIFLNLLVNASEALEKVEQGGREITITTGCPAPGLVEVTVCDTGVGVVDVDVKQMFERFVSTKPGGIGMGLAISRSIVEAHGGRIYARANADRGLTVHVELPAEA